MSFENYSQVVLKTDKYQADGVTIGDVGFIIEVYDDQFYEVEFSDKATGKSIAQIVVHENEIILFRS